MSENSNQNSVVSVRVVEIIVALMFLVVGLVVMTGSIKLGAKWGSDGPESGYFPFYISLIILVSSSITLFQAFKNKEQAEEAFVEKEPFRQIIATEEYKEEEKRLHKEIDDLLQTSSLEDIMSVIDTYEYNAFTANTKNEVMFLFQRCANLF